VSVRKKTHRPTQKRRKEKKKKKKKKKEKKKREEEGGNRIRLIKLDFHEHVSSPSTPFTCCQQASCLLRTEILLSSLLVTESFQIPSRQRKQPNGAATATDGRNLILSPWLNSFVGKVYENNESD